MERQLHHEQLVGQGRSPSRHRCTARHGRVTALGITNGTGATTCSPYRHVNRAEVATFAIRLYDAAQPSEDTDGGGRGRPPYRPGEQAAVFWRMLPHGLSTGDPVAGEVFPLIKP